MRHPTIASVEGVSKRFIVNKERSLKETALAIARRRSRRQDFWALKDINLDIKAGTTVGLVGHNGSGKSTLLKVIGGILEPTTGTVARRGRLAALLELGAGFHPDLTGRENVYLNAAILGLTKKETHRYFDEMVDFSGIERFIDTQVRFYSSGMYVRLGFSVAVHVDPDLLLVDEVLAVGDEPFQRKCIDKIASFQEEGRTIILVSHSAEHVQRLCDRVAVLDSGALVHDGTAAEGIAELRAQYEERARGAALQLSAGQDQIGRYSIERVVSKVTTPGGVPELSIAVTVDIREPDPTWALSLSIDTLVGTVMYAVHTYALDVTLPTTVGQHEIVFDFGEIALGAGSYLVSVGVINHFREEYAKVNAATMFEVPRSGEGQGLVHLDPRVRIDPRGSDT